MRWQSAGLEDRHILLAGNLHIAREQPQHLDNNRPLLLFVGDDLLASIESSPAFLRANQCNHIARGMHMKLTTCCQRLRVSARGLARAFVTGEFTVLNGRVQNTTLLGNENPIEINIWWRI
jgi:hypothetical protein